MQEIKLILICIVALLSSTRGYAQKTGPLPDEYTVDGIALGMNFGEYDYFELGYFKYTILNNQVTLGKAYTLENNYKNKVWTFVPKVGFWFSIAKINLGAHLPFAINTQGDHSLKIRPEIGFGHRRFKINYANNITFYNRDMLHQSKHLLTLHLFLEAADE